MVTKIDCQVLDFFNHGFQHLPGDGFYVTFDLHFDEPIENFFFGRNVALIQIGSSFEKEDESGAIFRHVDPHGIGKLRIDSLDQLDVLAIRVIVNVLQTLQHFQASLATLVSICQE